MSRGKTYVDILLEKKRKGVFYMCTTHAHFVLRTVISQQSVSIKWKANMLFKYSIKTILSHNEKSPFSVL